MASITTTAHHENGYVEDTIAFARDVALNGIGEGEPAHGFAITVMCT